MNRPDWRKRMKLFVSGLLVTFVAVVWCVALVDIIATLMSA